MASTEKKPDSSATPVSGKYVYGLGRRKRAIAQVRLYAEDKKLAGKVVVNGKPIEQYFTVATVAQIALAPLVALSLSENYYISAKVTGGGVVGQAGAVSLGIARALQISDEKVHTELKKQGFVTRDPREKERKKYNLHSARKAHQYTKR